MTGRRKLIEGLNPTDPEQDEREKEFVYGPTDTEAQQPEPQTVTEQPRPVPNSQQPHQPGVMPQYAGRVPITTRTRPEIASAVKRAALTRQLDGVVPFTVQDIVEEALELWLLTNGYLNNGRQSEKTSV